MEGWEVSKETDQPELQALRKQGLLFCMSAAMSLGARVFYSWRNNASLLRRAALMVTTEALVSEIPEEKKEPAMPGGHGGMGGF